jgi:TPR repeat protein
MKSFRLIFLGLLLAGANPVWANLDDAVQAYLRGEFSKAATLLRPIAEQGDSQAQTYMGRLYERGKGVPKDYVEAVKWYRLAADKGKADAQNYLGDMYRKGNGVSRDYAQAAAWYEKAAQQGVKAAQHNLGELYASGDGVGRDYVKAYMWFNVAAISGHEPYINSRDKVAKKMNKKQIEEAQKLSRQWIEAHP